MNEGLVEWPPSPFRLLRALIATGFTKLGWVEGNVPSVARGLILKLAEAPPTYHLPPAVVGQTRHYVDDPEGRDMVRRKILDAFAVVGRSAPLVVEFDVPLDPDEDDLVGELFEGLQYLGRAESWVDVARVDQIPMGLATCEPHQRAPSLRLECVRLLAPMGMAQFARWREQALTDLREFPPLRGRQKASRNLPEDAFQALSADMSSWRGSGWNRPHGTTWLSYWRESGLLTC